MGSIEQEKAERLARIRSETDFWSRFHFRFRGYPCRLHSKMWSDSIDPSRRWEVSNRRRLNVWRVSDRRPIFGPDFISDFEATPADCIVKCGVTALILHGDGNYRTGEG